jgi:ketosteroid isomerase-like protein
VDADVELIARTFRVMDSESYEQALPYISDDFVMETPANMASEPGVYRGPDGVRRWWESFLEAMDSVRLETLAVEDVDDADDGRAIVSFVIHARGKSSGIEAEQRAFAIATTAHGKISGLEFFTELELARAAARRRTAPS